MTTYDLPPEVEGHPLRDEQAWITLRDSGITPFDESDLITTQAARDEFLCGAWLLGLLDSIQPQMLRVTDALTAGRFLNAVIMPRRSSKTTTLFCVLLGRCYLRPVHMAGFTLLTTQKKTAERYRLDILAPISRRWPEEDARPVRLLKGSGTERVEFPNGSVLAALSPDGDAVRSGAYDTLLLDEAGEAAPERWEDVIGAVVPAFDTRPEGQLILAGTAGDYRRGSEFWTQLNNPKAGRIRFTLPDDIDPEWMEAWEPDEDHPSGKARELVEGMHPGLAGLTTLERIENSYRMLGAKRFIREYFGIFGDEGSNVALIPQPLWRAAALPLSDAAKPDLSSLCLFVHPDALWASLVQAWKGADGRTHVGLVHHQSSVAGLAKKVLTLSRSLGRPVVYDSASAATANVLADLKEARPPLQTRAMISNDVKRAAVRFMSLIREDGLRHHEQQEMNAAAEIAVRRAFGTGNGWAFGRPDVRRRPGDDITPIEAAALAVYALETEQVYRNPAEDFAF